MGSKLSNGTLNTYFPSSRGLPTEELYRGFLFWFVFGYDHGRDSVFHSWGSLCYFLHAFLTTFPFMRQVPPAPCGAPFLMNSMHFVVEPPSVIDRRSQPAGAALPSTVNGRFVAQNCRR